MRHEEIHARVKGYMVSLFDTPEEAITLDADLQKDLDLDSIDAVDLIVKLQEFTAQKISRKSSRPSAPWGTSSTGSTI